ncbi:MAG: Ig-like domain-containing protein [Chitinophagaceae bacterium]
MKSLASVFSLLIVYFVLSFVFTSCANIIPPSGGPVDSLPPIMLLALPKDSAVNFTGKKITLTFDEFVEAKEMQQNLLVNPLPINMPVVDYKLNNVYITLKDTLEPNTTYTINFGSAIKDVNEGNIAKNKSYIFSTGKTLDNYIIKGKVLLAKDGKVDSTLTVVLYANLNDTAVVKQRPRYLTKLDGAGKFTFTNLPKATYNIFALPNDYSKKYDDSTKLFAFLNEPIVTSDSIANYTLYAYREAEPANNINQAQNSGVKEKEDKKIRYTTSLTNSRYDLLDSSIQIAFNQRIALKATNAIQILDSNYKPLAATTILLDSTHKNITIKSNFSFDTRYYLILTKDSIADSMGVNLTKNDTVKFTSFNNNDYGKIKIRCNQTTKNAVLQVLKDGKIQNSFVITSKEIKQEFFKPGEYELRVLLDENSNGIWDAGNYKKKLQPEKVILIKNKLMVKAKWDNEMDLTW